MSERLTVTLFIDVDNADAVKELIENNGCSLPGIGQSVFHGGDVIGKVTDVFFEELNWISNADKQVYWEVVEACLSQFHGKTPEDAERLTAKYRKQMEEADVGDMVYHEEAFSAANGIAGSEVEMHKFIDQYEDIWDAKA